MREEFDEIVWLRNHDGTGSMHPCTPHCDDAQVYYHESIVLMLEADRDKASDWAHEQHRIADKYSARIATLEAENAALREAIGVAVLARDELQNAPELNPSNYSHEQACELNVKATNAFNLLSFALSDLGNE